MYNPVPIVILTMHSNVIYLKMAPRVALKMFSSLAQELGS